MHDKLQTGAYNTINTCLKLIHGDRLVIITDKETEEVGLALKTEAEKITTNVFYLLIEDFTSRPAKELPTNMIQQINEFKPTASIYSAQGKPGELPVFRNPLIEYLTKEHSTRHAHMIGITKKLMEDGMNQDYDLVYKVTRTVLDLVKNATQINVTDPHGTNIVFELDPDNIKWLPDDGFIQPINWTNLPGGEVFTAIKNANGVIVAWILGDYLSEKYGELKDPLVITVKNGLIENVEGPENIKKDFETYINEYENGRRAGELGIGTLIGLKGFTGNLLQDEKFPGVHVAFGHGYPEKTGSDWDCPSHIDVIARNTTIEVITPDKRTVIMEKGKYVDEILK